MLMSQIKLAEMNVMIWEPPPPPTNLRVWCGEQSKAEKDEREYKAHILNAEKENII